MSVKYLTVGEFVAVIKIYTCVALSKFCRKTFIYGFVGVAALDALGTMSNI